jgi:hypothetical protein
MSRRPMSCCLSRTKRVTMRRPRSVRPSPPPRRLRRSRWLGGRHCRGAVDRVAARPLRVNRAPRAEASLAARSASPNGVGPVDASSVLAVPVTSFVDVDVDRASISAGFRPGVASTAPARCEAACQSTSPGTGIPAFPGASVARRRPTPMSSRPTIEKLTAVRH